MTYKNYTLLGTSIAQGYYDETGKGWAKRLFEKLNVNKTGGYYYTILARAGDRAYDHWHRLCAEAIQRQEDGLFIEVSANDVIRQGSLNAQLDLSFGLREELWRTMLATAKKNFAEIYVTSALPKNENRMAQTRTPDWNVWYANSDIQAYNNQVQGLCAEFGVQFIDLFAGLNNPAYLDTLNDAVHPDSTGHEMIADLALLKLRNIGF